ncbi:MAG: porin family protein [Cytophagales bacterium]|nr:porin family protein [Cytophagales bacterium]
MKNTIATLLIGSVAMAAPAVASDSYVGVYGGVNLDNVIDSPIVKDKVVGTVVGGVVGKELSAVPGLRVELDASYRTNDVKLLTPLGGIDIDHETTAVMGNVVYDLPVSLLGGKPYLLAGLGVAETQVTFENVSLLQLETSGMAWQAGLGYNWTVADGVTAGVGYRYFQGPELDVLGTELSDGSNHSVVASVSFAM